jgi:ketosteroid isomerase-like protein
MDTTAHTADAEVEAFLDRYADALAGGDLPGIAGCYTLPALVAGDDAAIPISEPGQVEAAFAGAADAYKAQGLVGIRAELRGVDRLTPNLLLADVRWAYLDEGGEARRHSSYRYLLRRSAPEGRFGIQVVVDTTPPG